MNASSCSLKNIPRHFSLAAAVLSAALMTGCITGKQYPAATQPATTGDPKTALTSYWIDKPAITSVTAPSFDKLWSACRDALLDDGFLIDRTDYREGVLTTLPLTSKQSYEFWRNDVVDFYDLTQSTLGTMRRTVRFDIKRLDDGTYRASPKVVVERYTMVEKRITSVAQYQNVYSLTAQDVQLTIEEQGNIPAEYWYAVGRDNSLEKQLAQSAAKKLR